MKKYGFEPLKQETNFSDGKYPDLQIISRINVSQVIYPEVRWNLLLTFRNLLQANARAWGVMVNQSQLIHYFNLTGHGGNLVQTIPGET